MGLSRLIQVLGFTLPALVGAHFIHGRRYHKPFLLATCAVGRAGLLTLPLLFLTSAQTRPAVTLGWFLLVYAVFWLMDGACAVSWFDIIAKTIPGRVRGRFFGSMQTLSGLAAIGAGFGVKAVLQGWIYPANFVLLCVGLSAGVLVSLLFLGMIREPGSNVPMNSERPTFGQFVKSGIPLLRSRPRLRRLIVIRLLLDGASMALPFYVLFAARDLHAGLGMVGVFAIVQSAGRVCSGPMWGWLSDQAGPVAGLRAVAACTAMIPGFALLATRGGPTSASALLAVFALIGAVQDGIWMAGSNALLECVSEEERPLAVGASSLFQAPGALFGPAGGLLAELASYPAVFCMALGFGLAALFMSTRLPLSRAAS